MTDPTASIIATQAGLTPITRDPANDELVLACDDFFLFGCWQDLSPWNLSVTLR